MKGLGTTEEAKQELKNILDNGGSFYDYATSIDAPETMKNRLIEEYERQTIIEKLGLAPYPFKSLDEYDYKKYSEWATEQNKIITNYKKEHPDEFQH